MTRKRYVKILMSHGIDRDTANRNASAVRYLGWSYQRFYDELMTLVVADRVTRN